MENQSKIDWKKHEQGVTKPFFKGVDVKTVKVIITTKAFREVVLQFSGNSVVMDFDYKGNEESLPMNVTNIRKLNELSKYNPEWLIGQQLVLKKVLVTNPKTKQEVPSWRIDSLKPEKKAEKVK